MTTWEAELAARPWSEATLEVRKQRRPRGWQTTPQGLVERARLGDPGAVESLCKRYWELVRNYLKRLPNTDPTLAEDATQEFFLGLLRRDEKRNDLGRLTLRAEDSFGAWLAGGAKHARSNVVKREKRHQPLGDESKPEPPSVREADSSRAENRAKQLLALRAQDEAREHHLPPDRVLDLVRALELVELGFARLEPEYDPDLFAHLKTTLLEEGADSARSDLELCRQLGFSCTYVSQNRSTLRWHKLPAAMLALQEERRARPPSTPATATPSTSAREELWALASAFGH